jgi:hypothetical protein
MCRTALSIVEGKIDATSAVTKIDTADCMTDVEMSNVEVWEMKAIAGQGLPTGRHLLCSQRQVWGTQCGTSAKLNYSQVRSQL